MSETIFAKILTGEIPSYKIYEDDDVYAFLDISQATVGHTLVIPKIASYSLLETDDKIAAKVFTVATKLAKHIVTTLGADGCNILSNAHASAGQEVFHFHVHIIPRFTDDTGVKFSLLSSNPSAETLQTLQQKLTNI